MPCEEDATPDAHVLGALLERGHVITVTRARITSDEKPHGWKPGREQRCRIDELFEALQPGHTRDDRHHAFTRGETKLLTDPVGIWRCVEAVQVDAVANDDDLVQGVSLFEEPFLDRLGVDENAVRQVTDVFLRARLARCEIHTAVAH